MNLFARLVFPVLIGLANLDAYAANVTQQSCAKLKQAAADLGLAANAPSGGNRQGSYWCDFYLVSNRSIVFGLHYRGPEILDSTSSLVGYYAVVRQSGRSKVYEWDFAADKFGRLVY